MPSGIGISNGLGVSQVLILSPNRIYYKALSLLLREFMRLPGITREQLYFHVIDQEAKYDELDDPWLALDQIFNALDAPDLTLRNLVCFVDSESFRNRQVSLAGDLSLIHI